MNSYPVALNFDPNDSSVSSVSNNLYPYTHNYWEETVKKFHITVPFEIMDRTVGTSKCDKCRQVYSGSQQKCVKMVEATVFKHPKWNNSVDRGYWPIGYIKYNSYNEEAIGHTEIACGGYCQWTHTNQFYEQTSFFTFLESLRASITDDRSFFKHYKDCFPPGLCDVLEKNMLINKVNQLEMENSNIKYALKQIAQKMNAAGSCLSFGF